MNYKYAFNKDSIDENDLLKCYTVIHTGASTRVVTSDLVSDASPESFIYILKKFIWRRGCSQIIISDIGSPFAAGTTQQFVSNESI